MPTKTLAGTPVDTDDEGYLVNHSQWNKDVAAALAAEEGITLTDRHWEVINFIDADFKERGAVPGLRRMNKVGKIPIKVLYALFPDGPIKKAARIGGYPKPVYCV